MSTTAIIKLAVQVHVHVHARVTDSTYRLLLTGTMKPNVT